MRHDSKTHAVWDNRLLNQIINSMADGVFTLDVEGRITSWNLSMERISGFTAGDAVNKTCAIMNFNSCFGKKCPANLNACGILKHGLAEVKECVLRHRDGFEVPVIKNAGVVRDENDHIIGVVETITDLTELKKARQKAEEATRRLAELHRLDNIIGKTHEMQKVFEAIKLAAASDATVLIQGESGTGKELVAGAIHYRSARANHPLVVVNCSALSESLMESELFGHAKGAYTGAIRDRVGRFEEANRGTVFLDEIGELGFHIQVKLLRVLQEREIERVGESTRRKIDIRIIAATHQDLLEKVHKSGFREDLYYRLKVFPIRLPPLRMRKNDIPLLTNHFIKIENKKTGKQIQNLSPEAMRILMDHSWPGNVRELENAIEHAFVLCTNEQIEVADLPLEIRQRDYQLFRDDGFCIQNSSPKPRRKITKEALLELLHACEWNKADVGRRIGLSRTAIWKYMKKWNIPLNKQDK
jgi:two-component system, NtrC family, response regulator HydG